MSLYNALFGVNQLASFYLSMLGLSMKEVGRFRDCYLLLPKEGTAAEPEIVIFTRNGGGNREHWAFSYDTPPGESCECPGCIITHRLPKHPQYVRDFDDDFDCTYASVVFRVPPQFKDFVGLVLAKFEGQQQNPGARFKDLITKLESGEHKDDPAVKRAMEVGEGIAAQLDAAFKGEQK